MIAQQTFGRRGYIIVSGLLSTVVIGWFAFQVGLTGATLHASFGANTFAMNLLAGALYMGITYVGIKALTVVGWIAAPLYIIMGILALHLALHNLSWHQVFTYTPTIKIPTALTFGAAVTIVVAGFSDSGTMTPDFTRWAKSGRPAVIAALSAFPLADMIALGVGGLIVATGVITNPLTNGGNFMMVLSDHGLLLTLLAIVFVFANLGSVCAHCLYNGAIGWSHITGSTMRKLTLFWGVLGTIAALLGIWSLFVNWLNLLGVVVPPIGAILIADQIILRRSLSTPHSALPTWRIESFIAWVVGSAIALWVQLDAPSYSEAVTGLVSAFVIYLAIYAFMRRAVASETLTESVSENVLE